MCCLTLYIVLYNYKPKFHLNRFIHLGLVKVDVEIFATGLPPQNGMYQIS